MPAEAGLICSVSSFSSMSVSDSIEANKKSVGGLLATPCCDRRNPDNPVYTLNELPQPQVLFTFGLLNLNPEPSRVST